MLARKRKRTHLACPDRYSLQPPAIRPASPLLVPPPPRATSHLFRLLALLVGDMKAARARPAAAVAPPALRLLPGAARGAGLRSRTPWLFSVSPAEGRDGQGGERQ